MKIAANYGEWHPLLMELKVDRISLVVPRGVLLIKYNDDHSKVLNFI